MRIRTFWHDDPVGICDINLLPSEVASSGFLSVLAVFQQDEGIALGFRLLGDGEERSLDLSEPVVTRTPANLDLPSGLLGYLRADFDGPAISGHIRADLEGPGVYGHIRADLEGPGVYGHIRADLEGPGVYGRIRADLEGPGVYGRIRADLEGPGVYGRIRADLEGPGVYGRIRAELDGPRIDGFISADFEGPGTQGRISVDLFGPRTRGHIRAQITDESLPHSWQEALQIILSFIVQRDREVFQFSFFTLLRDFPEIGRPVLSRQAERALSEYVPVDQPWSLAARRALQQHSAYFEQLITERPREAALALENVTSHMLTSAPLLEEAAPREPVRLGLCTPRSAPVSSSFLINFVAYIPELEELITEQLTKANPQAVPHLDYHRVAWQLGTEVQVRVYGSNLRVEPKRDSFVWNGEKEQLDFKVDVSAEAPIGETLLKTDVFVEGIRISRIWLPIDITMKDSEKGVLKMSGFSAPVSAFVSYSSADRPRVLDRIASLIIRTGMDLVMDCITLRPSQRWRALIPDLILESDLLLLFWSQDAARSEWIEWEWQHALEHKGLSGIEIHPLVPYGSAPLPSELRELHAGDPLMVYREFEVARSKLNGASGRPTGGRSEEQAEGQDSEGEEG